jgi:hypothetical protein
MVAAGASVAAAAVAVAAVAAVAAAAAGVDEAGSFCAYLLSLTTGALRRRH